MSFPDNMFAGDGDEGSFTPTQIFSGSKAVFTDHRKVKDATAIAYLQAVAVDANDELVPHNPAAGNTEAEAVGICAAPIAATTPGVSTGFYIGGCFNPLVLTFDAATDTLAKQREVFKDTEITIKHLK